MTIDRISVDHDLLPSLLLPQIKEHLRVRHDRDDMLITNYVAASIGLIERKCNVSLDPASYVCTTDELGCPTSYRRTPSQRSWRLPVNNVRSVTIDDGLVPPTDYSASFAVWNPDLGGNGSSFLVAADGTPLSTSWQLQIEAGIDDADQLAPAFFALIARMTGGLYENREASSALWADTWDSELMALWRPSA